MTTVARLMLLCLAQENSLGISTTLFRKREQLDRSLPAGSCGWGTADMRCGAASNTSVQVGTDCYYSGSANYVVFGTMCKLCFDYYARIPDHPRYIYRKEHALSDKSIQRYRTVWCEYARRQLCAITTMGSGRLCRLAIRRYPSGW